MGLIQHAVILAAGRGTRMGPLTEVVPKPMAPLQGSTLIAKGIKNLTGSIPKIHITVGYKKAMLAQHVIENGVSSVLNTEGQSNSWWIFNTLLQHLDEPMFVLTCDNITELDFALLEKSYYDAGAPPCMLVPVRPVPGLEGDYIFAKNQVVTEVNRNKPSDIYCSGVQIINPAKVCELVREQGDFYSVWNQLIAQKKLMVSSVYPKKWTSIDTFAQLSQFNDANPLVASDAP
jgi:NDP-sugar pyrophosphorylase family protein